MDPNCGTMVLEPRPGALTLALPHTFLLATGDSVWSMRGAWHEGTDYALDRTRGELRLLREPMPSETLWVQACWLMAPPPLELHRYQYHPASAKTDSAPPLAAAPEPRPGPTSLAGSPAGVSLALSGNKSVAVEFGSSQDAVLKQSLDLALTGTLAPGVQLTGVLTDRSTPVTETGSTLNLQEADQVRLELTAPAGGATLGDLSLRFDDGEFGRLERRLQGASGQLNTHGFQTVVAAASAAGEYQRMQFFGVEGLQGPYALTGRDGQAGISVVAGSEIVTLDGARLTRGESADYSIDYEAARLTFTSRHLITAASRITIDYQFTLQNYKRNFAALGTRWNLGAMSGFARFLSEADDRGRPLGAALSPQDELVLAASGDSAWRAIAPGVTRGPGDYDSVLVVGRPAYAFAGPDSGHFAVSFAPVGAGRGDYSDSALVSGRTIYRYVGPGQGSFVVGQALPMPESHQLWVVGDGVKLGAMRFDVEGAASHHDLNTFSNLDDANDNGYAGRALLGFEGRPGLLGGRGALTLEARGVDVRFAPFQALTAPFEAEHWGLPTQADFEHSRRVTANAQWSPTSGGRLTADAGQLATPDGFSSRRLAVDWAREGMLTTRALWERALSTQSSALDPDGGRNHARAEVLWAARWLAPALHAETDERKFPSDTGGVGDRFRSAGAALSSGSAWNWHAAAGADLRRDAQRTHDGFQDQSESRSYTVSFDSPTAQPFSATLLGQRRDVLPLANPSRTSTDLASARLRGESAKRGLRGELDLEVGSEGANRRTRTLTYAGPGLGAYDQFGNFVGHGDYNLTLGVSSDIERLAKVASRGRAAWTFGSSDEWRGSRAEFTYEGDAQRNGNALSSDLLLSPGAALADPGLAHGNVLQRLESDLAPQSRVASFHVRLERHVSSDRTYANFSQVTDDRELSTRWRTRPTRVLSNEVELTLKRQSADQSLVGSASAAHTVDTRSISEQLVAVPDSRLRAVAAAELSLSHAPGQLEDTRTLLVGPDLGISVGRAGRIEVTARRGYVSGPPAVALIPTADPAGAPVWQGTARLDYRLLQTFTLGWFSGLKQFQGQRAIVNGRLEMRAFF